MNKVQCDIWYVILRLHTPDTKNKYLTYCGNSDGTEKGYEMYHYRAFHICRIPDEIKEMVLFLTSYNTF